MSCLEYSRVRAREEQLCAGTHNNKQIAVDISFTKFSIEIRRKMYGIGKFFIYAQQ